ncbi:hypothetical protein [Halosimplex amylolyticum]|uniref:hypothetical protein n=1 Tax=Halosimplex amylolyticum TaxID=3396616 RepID=UPI003F553F52
MDVRLETGAAMFGEAGLRGFCSQTISTSLCDEYSDDQFARARRFINEYHGTYHGPVRATISPPDDRSCTREPLRRTGNHTREHPGLFVQTRLLELEEIYMMSWADGEIDSHDLLEEVRFLGNRHLVAVRSVGLIVA